MFSVTKILVDLDPTRDEQPALERGIYLAKEFGAKLTLFLADYNRGLVSNLFFDSEQLEKAKQGYLNTRKRWVDSYLQTALSAGVDADSDIVWHKPVYEAINIKAESQNYDLVIKSTHKHPTVNKLFFTPNDWQLIKTNKKPILLAKSNGNTIYQNILGAVDPSNRHSHSADLNPLILKTTQSLADTMDANAQAVYCYDPIGYQLWSDIGVGMGGGVGPVDFAMDKDSYEQYTNQFKQDSEKSFDSCINDANFSSTQNHLLEGYPETLLPELVKKERIDLLVMGTSYHSGLIGSTIEKILDEVDCDLLAVKVDE